MQAKSRCKGKDRDGLKCAYIAGLLGYRSPMRTRLLVPVIALAVVLSGCGSSGSNAKSSETTAAPGGSGTTAAPGTDGSGKGSGSGSVDCAAIKKAGGEMTVWVQLLAQLDSPDSVTPIKNKEIGNLDLDKFQADMTTLHQLDGYSSPLGDPKEAIDVYEKAAKAAKVLFATDPIDQAAIDTYMKNVGTVGTFLGHQTAIAGAMDAADC